jgi:hypothetical protein
MLISVRTHPQSPPEGGEYSAAGNRSCGAYAYSRALEASLVVSLGASLRVSTTAQATDLLTLSAKSKRFAASDDRFTAANPAFTPVSKPIRQCGTRIALALVGV